MSGTITLDSKSLTDAVLNTMHTNRYVIETVSDTIERVLSKNDMKSVLPGCIGVGSPFIVSDPDTYQPMMLFTAWSDTKGLARQLWIADIDENLRVTNMRKLADGSLFNVTGLNSATAFWDDYNEEWVFAATAYGAPKTSYGYFIFFDKNWNVKGTQVLDFSQTVSGYTWEPNLGDAGIGMVPTDSKMLVLSAGFDNHRSLFYINDYTVRPLPNPVIGTPLVVKDSTLYKSYLGPAYYAHGRDVHQLMVYNGQLIMLSEAIAWTDLWRLIVEFGPDKDWNVVAGYNMIGKYMLVTPVSWSHGKMNYTHMTPNEMMHPHYTTLLGRPYLFFINCPHWNAGGVRAYAHEIWAQAIKPEDAFDPKKNFPLTAEGINEPYYVNLPIPTFGAKRMSIYLYGVATNGTLTVYESTSPYHIWRQPDSAYSTTYSITSGLNKIAIDYPMLYVAIKTDVNLSDWVIIFSG
jgi:hypothetical protein